MHRVSFLLLGYLARKYQGVFMSYTDVRQGKGVGAAGGAPQEAALPFPIRLVT
jgi:hypothetical protein